MSHRRRQVDYLIERYTIDRAEACNLLETLESETSSFSILQQLEDWCDHLEELGRLSEKGVVMEQISYLNLRGAGAEVIVPPSCVPDDVKGNVVGIAILHHEQHRYSFLYRGPSFGGDENKLLQALELVGKTKLVSEKLMLTFDDLTPDAQNRLKVFHEAQGFKWPQAMTLTIREDGTHELSIE